MLYVAMLMNVWCSTADFRVLTCVAFAYLFQNEAADVRYKSVSITRSKSSGQNTNPRLDLRFTQRNTCWPVQHINGLTVTTGNLTVIHGMFLNVLTVNWAIINMQTCTVQSLYGKQRGDIVLQSFCCHYVAVNCQMTEHTNWLCKDGCKL